MFQSNPAGRGEGRTQDQQSKGADGGCTAGQQASGRQAGEELQLEPGMAGPGGDDEQGQQPQEGKPQGWRLEMPPQIRSGAMHTIGFPAGASTRPKRLVLPATSRCLFSVPPTIKEITAMAVAARKNI